MTSSLPSYTAKPATDLHFIKKAEEDNNIYGFDC